MAQDLLSKRTPEPESLGIVVLAAGKGERMGGRAKCLLEYKGEPLICRQLRELCALEPANMVVVLGHYAPMVRTAIARMQLPVVVRTVEQPAEAHAQPSSIRLGLGALPPDLSAVMVCPSDLPLLESGDYLALLQAYCHRNDGVGFVGPLVNGIPGNPVVFDAQVRQQIAQREGQFGCGNWRRQADDSVWNWPVDNTRYITDVDTEQDLQQLEQQHGVCLHWPHLSERV